MKNLKILFAIVCSKNFDNSILYSWLWIIMPDWRYWLQWHGKEVYSRAYKLKKLSFLNQLIWKQAIKITYTYSNFKWDKVDRADLWEKNNYSKKLIH